MSLESSPSRPRFSILALDGGGARGYLSAKILEHVEAYLDAATGEELPLGARFDLIAGTSTGGITALALAIGRPAREIAGLYETQLPEIFGPAMRRRAFARYFKPQYRSAALRHVVEEILSAKTLGDLQTDACVIAVSLVNAQPRIFRSDYVKSGLSRSGERLADLAMATSAAPTYFEAQSVRGFSHLADGALCANNPTLVGVAEAFRFGRESRRGVVPPRDLGAVCQDCLAVLSVGTGEQCAMPYEPESLLNAGSLQWGARFHNVAIESQSQLVHTLSRALIGSAYRRINPRLDFPMAMDDARRAPALKNLSELSEGAETFLRTHLAQPCTV